MNNCYQNENENENPIDTCQGIWHLICILINKRTHSNALLSAQGCHIIPVEVCLSTCPLCKCTKWQLWSSGGIIIILFLDETLNREIKPKMTDVLLFSLTAAARLLVQCHAAAGVLSLFESINIHHILDPFRSDSHLVPSRIFFNLIYAGRVSGMFSISDQLQQTSTA